MHVERVDEVRTDNENRVHSTEHEDLEDMILVQGPHPIPACGAGIG